MGPCEVFCRAISIFSVLINIVSILVAQNAINSQPECGPLPALAGQKRVIVDVSKTGQQIMRKFRINDEVVVAIYNKNPYRYSYSSTVESRPLSQDFIGDFFGAIQFPGDLPSKKDVKMVEDSGRAPTCSASEANKKISDYEQYRNQSFRDGDINELNRMMDKADKYNEFIDSVSQESINCELVFENGVTLRPMLTELITYDVRSKLKAFSNADNALASAKRAVEEIPKNGREKTSCENRLDFYSSDHDDIKTVFETAKVLQERVGHFEKLGDILDEVSGENEAFSSNIRIPFSDQPTNTTVTVRRTDRKSKRKDTVAIVSIDSGEVPFSLSVGVGFSFIRDIEIIRQTSVGDDMIVVNTFGYKSNSSFTPSGIGMISPDISSER